MKNYYPFFFFVFLIFVSCKSTINKPNSIKNDPSEFDISMYPKENDSIQRFIIELPTKENENLFELEVWVGKTIKVDCNKYIFPGEFTKKTIQGWGYSYYEFSTSGNMIGTQMACPDTTNTEKFIRSKTEHIRYNSKLPVVIYCPKGFEVEYAIWSKNETPIKAIIQ